MTKSQNRKFGKKALNRLSMSEQLDRTLSVTPARGWIALLAIVVAATAVGIWSIVGEVATYVEAHGFLLNRGGKVVDAVATGQGRLQTIVAAVGDEIEENDVVAMIVNEELAARHASAMALVEERTQTLAKLKAAIEQESGIVRANRDRRRKQLEELEATGREMLEVARASFDNSRQLFDDGIVTRVQLDRTQQEFNEARRVLLDLSREKGALDERAVMFENENATRIREMESQVDAARYQARELAILVSAERVVAPVSGQVTEIKVSTGAIVGPGTAVASIRTGTMELEVLLYVPPDKGKQVEAGMEALVSPVTVRREEYGAMKGTVETLSPFPASLEGMIAVLQNRSLALGFSEDGPPYAGRISLLSDPTTASGFAWTSPKAVNQRPTVGTLASVEIKTRSQPPITLAIPLLKELLGI